MDNRHVIVPSSENVQHFLHQSIRHRNDSMARIIPSNRGVSISNNNHFTNQTSATIQLKSKLIKCDNPTAILRDLEMMPPPPPPPPVSATPPVSLTHSPPQSATKIFANLLISQDSEVEFYKHENELLAAKANGSDGSSCGSAQDDFEDEDCISNLGRKIYHFHFSWFLCNIYVG